MHKIYGKLNIKLCVDNLVKEIHKIKCRYRHDNKKQETGGIKQKDCKHLNTKTLSMIYRCRNVQEIC